MKSKKELLHKEASSKGGQTTLERYGSKHFSKLAKDAWKARRKNKPK